MEAKNIIKKKLEIDLGLGYLFVSDVLIWMRLWKDGPGIALKRVPLSFSERKEYKRYMPLPFGWRATWLK